MQFFILKPKTTSFFSPTHPFMRGTVYHKNWQNHEMGQKKNRFSKLAQKIRLMIYQTLCILSLIKNHIQKWKFEAICVLRGWKYGRKKFGALKSYFWSLGAQMVSNFRFCLWFLISDKIQRVWYIIGRMYFLCYFENRLNHIIEDEFDY